MTGTPNRLARSVEPPNAAASYSSRVISLGGGRTFPFESVTA